jgi:hypothetical protein
VHRPTQSGAGWVYSYLDKVGGLWCTLSAGCGSSSGAFANISEMSSNTRPRSNRSPARARLGGRNGSLRATHGALAGTWRACDRDQPGHLVDVVRSAGRALRFTSPRDSSRFKRAAASSLVTPAVRLPLRPGGQRVRERGDQTRVGDDPEAKSGRREPSRTLGFTRKHKPAAELVIPQISAMTFGQVATLTLRDVDGAVRLSRHLSAPPPGLSARLGVRPL